MDDRSLIVRARMNETDASSEVFLERNPDLLERETPLRFYSRDALFSVAARATFVAPDLAPLPSG